MSWRSPVKDTVFSQCKSVVYLSINDVYGNVAHGLHFMSTFLKTRDAPPVNRANMDKNRHTH